MKFLKQWTRALKPRFSQEQCAKIISHLLGALVPMLHYTWRVTVENQDRVDALLREHGSVILVTWHGRMLVPIAATRGRGYYALVSRSNDGTMLAAIFEKLGWNLIRGSSGRSAVEALRTGLEVLSKPGTVLAFTPDGPRGPERIAKSGMIYFGQKLGKPIIPVGVSAYPCKRLSSWDRFMVPLPFSSCLLIYGDPIYARRGDDLEELTQRVQSAINKLEEEAERRLGYTEEESGMKNNARPSRAKGMPPSEVHRD